MHIRCMNVKRHLKGIDLGVAGRDPLVRPLVFAVGVRAVRADAVDAAGDDEREDLLAGPQRLGLEDGRLRDAPVPRRQVHQQVHEIALQSAQQIHDRTSLDDVRWCVDRTRQSRFQARF